MNKSENQKGRKDRFKQLTSEERKLLIRNKLKKQGLIEGSGVQKKDQSSYDKQEIIDLIKITSCL
tara:strand:- start:2717 stop:2911 length:195 start_codon:yes stop_codon:yes gene_type:complete